MGQNQSRDGDRFEEIDGNEDEFFDSVVEEQRASESVASLGSSMAHLSLREGKENLSPLRAGAAAQPVSTPLATGTAGLSSSHVASTKEKQVSSTRLYQRLVGANSDGGKAGKWIIAEKIAPWSFQKEEEAPGHDEDEEEEEVSGRRRAKTGRTGGRGNKSKARSKNDSPRRWWLCVGTRVRVFVSPEMNLTLNDAQLRADFIADGVWTLRFADESGYSRFCSQFQDCLFENLHNLEANKDNRTKVLGQEFAKWADGSADEGNWESEREKPVLQEKTGEFYFGSSSSSSYDGEFDTDGGSSSRVLKQRYGGTPTRCPKSLTMGIGMNSYVVHEGGLDVFRNQEDGLLAKNQFIRVAEFGDGLTPTKGMLMQGETNMMLLGGGIDSSETQGVQQLNIDTGTVVRNWQFAKSGVPIEMRDITQNMKGTQLSDESTFLGLNKNVLCRWDMRDKQGIVSQGAEVEPAVLTWEEGHTFASRTNFTSFATTGDGCIAVGSQDGQVRLYSTTSINQAKTKFPGLGHAVTHIDTTFDGRYVLATTDYYAMLISTTFRDKDGAERSAFKQRAINDIPSPRLLKLTAVDFEEHGRRKFHNAQFSWVTQHGRTERYIVVAMGSSSVVRGFRRVKQAGHECYQQQSRGLKECHCYRIIERDQEVVDSKFMHDNYSSSKSDQTPLVVATPKDIISVL